MTATERPEWVDDTVFPFESRFAEVDGNVVHYVDEGSGPVLLMLHSNPVWSFVYRDVIIALREQFRCVALDFPGFGLSTAGPDYGFHADDHAELLVAFLDQLGLSELTLVAHGWGGPLGLYAAEQRPNLFQRLILTNTWAWPLNGDLFSEVASRGMGNPVGRALMGRFNPLVNYFIPTTHKRRKVTSAEMAHYRNATSTPEQRRASATQPADLVGAREFFIQLVEHLAPVSSLPTLIVWGDSNLIFTDKYRKRLELTFPNHTTRTLHRVGHYPMSDAPEEFAIAIRDWHPHSGALNTPE
ncbi:alpha/beta fold hydrolase [Mycobacterium sp. MYCO198283]|uniref:alpha/beta fold hydrolase n=1 Tax=Mycobacterium sp. MYCO198283 TaxID=2883505 RepID=UPI001E5513A8|nr:alpha/beta fold hydrolase [Mycobacterium sp. MYCO198283]MCG5430964.1 alpha/beta fold hydrolase [Mycobacterium sp. MYCO198283]